MSLTVPATSSVAAFDYSQFSPEAARSAKAAVDLFHSQRRRFVADTIRIGQQLIAVKDSVGHGLFTEWLNAEFEDGARTAQNYMTTARQYGDKPEIVSDLPLSVVYKLASPSVPDDVRQQVEAKAREGEGLKAAEVRQMIADGIDADRQRRANEREAARRAKLSDQQLKDEDRKEKTQARSRAARQAEHRLRQEAWEQERERAGLARARMAAMLAENIGPERDAFIAELAYVAGADEYKMALGIPAGHSGLYQHAASLAQEERSQRDPVEAAFKRLQSAWGSADQKARQQFVAWVQKGAK